MKAKKSLVAQYEIMTGYKGNIVSFGEKFTDIIVLNTYTNQTLAWNIKEAKEKMGLRKNAKNELVIPYLINILLIDMQERDWDELKKSKKKSKKKA